MGSTTPATGRGWADLITSAVDLGCSADELESFLRETRLPASLLPNFLHEFAHFYCLRSSVGGMIASLYLEAQDWLLALAERAVRERAEEVSPGAPPTAVRVDTAVRLLRPLLEGMALFAEHDLFPGKATVTSNLAFWFARLFLPLRSMPRDTDAAALDRATGKLLLTYRSVPEFDGPQSWARTKASLLLQPLALDGGGYLAGYLTVRNLWQIARHNARSLANTDLFFMYFYSLIFDDYGLVEILLDDDIDEAARAKKMLERLQARMQLLRDRSLEDRVTEYQAAVAERKDDAIGMDGHYGSIFLDEAFVKRIREIIRKRREQWLLSERTEAGRSLLFDHACEVLHRELMRIGLIWVTVEVTGEGQVIGREGDEVRFTGPAKVGVSPGAGSGFLAVYFDPRRMGRVALCFRANEVVWEEFPEECESREDRAKIVYAIYHTSKAESKDHSFEAELERRTGVAVDANKWLRGSFQSILGRFYASLATGFAMPGRGQANIEAMQASGLKNIVGRPDLATALALFGLLSSCRISYGDAVEVFSLHGLEILECERALNDRALASGLPLVCPEPEKGSCFKPAAGVISMM